MSKYLSGAREVATLQKLSEQLDKPWPRCVACGEQSYQNNEYLEGWFCPRCAPKCASFAMQRAVTVINASTMVDGKKKNISGLRYRDNGELAWDAGVRPGERKEPPVGFFDPNKIDLSKTDPATITQKFKVGDRVKATLMNVDHYGCINSFCDGTRAWVNCGSGATGWYNINDLASAGYKKRADFASDAEYGEYVKENLRVGMKVKALGLYGFTGIVADVKSNLGPNSFDANWTDINGIESFGWCHCFECEILDQEEP